MGKKKTNKSHTPFHFVPDEDDTRSADQNVSTKEQVRSADDVQGRELDTGVSNDYPLEEHAGKEIDVAADIDQDPEPEPVAIDEETILQESDALEDSSPEHDTATREVLEDENVDATPLHSPEPAPESDPGMVIIDDIELQPVTTDDPAEPNVPLTIDKSSRIEDDVEAVEDAIVEFDHQPGPDDDGGVPTSEKGHVTFAKNADVPSKESKKPSSKKKGAKPKKGKKVGALAAKFEDPKAISDQPEVLLVAAPDMSQEDMKSTTAEPETTMDGTDDLADAEQPVTPTDAADQVLEQPDSIEEDLTVTSVPDSVPGEEALTQFIDDEQAPLVIEEVGTYVEVEAGAEVATYQSIQGPPDEGPDPIVIDQELVETAPVEEVLDEQPRDCVAVADAHLPVAAAEIPIESEEIITESIKITALEVPEQDEHHQDETVEVDLDDGPDVIDAHENIEDVAVIQDVVHESPDESADTGLAEDVIEEPISAEQVADAELATVEGSAIKASENVAEGGAEAVSEPQNMPEITEEAILDSVEPVLLTAEGHADVDTAEDVVRGDEDGAGQVPGAFEANDVGEDEVAGSTAEEDAVAMEKGAEIIDADAIIESPEDGIDIPAANKDDTPVTEEEAPDAVSLADEIVAAKEVTAVDDDADGTETVEQPTDEADEAPNAVEASHEADVAAEPATDVVPSEEKTVEDNEPGELAPEGSSGDSITVPSEDLAIAGAVAAATVASAAALASASRSKHRSHHKEGSHRSSHHHEDDVGGHRKQLSRNKGEKGLFVNAYSRAIDKARLEVERKHESEEHKAKKREKEERHARHREDRKRRDEVQRERERQEEKEREDTRRRRRRDEPTTKTRPQKAIDQSDDVQHQTSETHRQSKRRPSLGASTHSMGSATFQDVPGPRPGFLRRILTADSVASVASGAHSHATTSSGRRKSFSGKMLFVKLNEGDQQADLDKTARYVENDGSSGGRRKHHKRRSTDKHPTEDSGHEHKQVPQDEAAAGEADAEIAEVDIPPEGAAAEAEPAGGQDLADASAEQAANDDQKDEEKAVGDIETTAEDPGAPGAAVQFEYVDLAGDNGATIEKTEPQIVSSEQTHLDSKDEKEPKSSSKGRSHHRKRHSGDKKSKSSSGSESKRRDRSGLHERERDREKHGSSRDHATTSSGGSHHRSRGSHRSDDVAPIVKLWRNVLVR